VADWNQIYKEKLVADATPARVLLDNQHLLPVTGKALDYASGLSGNGVFMASQGLQVRAWDLSEVAVEKVNNYASDNGIAINAEVKNLESSSEEIQGQFDVVVVSFFLHRDSFQKIYNLLNPGGILFYQTFCGEQINGVGPSRADFRLQRGELLTTFKNMRLLSYREDLKTDRINAMPDQVYFVAQKI